jgi:ADP-ribose pyrophosphatase YjhB (NUDIX family)
MAEIACVGLNGQVVQVPAEQITIRPAAYALMVRNGKVLLLKMKQTGKYHLPGGGIAAGERLEAGLARELYEETGVKVEIRRLAHFEELFFYYNPSGRAYHGLHFFYICMPKPVALVPDDQVQDEAAGEPRWIAIAGLCAQDFQAQGEAILRLCREA